MRGIILLRATSSQLRHQALHPPPPRHPSLFHTSRALSTTPPHRQNVFHAQSSSPSTSALLSSLTPPPTTPQTLTEKIIQRHSLNLPKTKLVKSGDYVTLSPHHCMTHDNSWPVALKFLAIGATKIHSPRQIVMTLDHDVQNRSPSNIKKYTQIEEFAKSQDVDFYPAGRGIGHQIMIEEGYAWPGSLAVASDSHSNMYGGISCLGTPVVRTDAASIWATGRTWWQIPPIAKVHFTGVLPRGVTGKDAIIALCGLFPNDEVLNHAIEFAGPTETMRSLPVDHRLAIANMTTEWGALSGLFPMDDVLYAWLRARATAAALATSMDGVPPHPRFTHERVESLFSNPITADPGATYAKHLHLNLSTLSPYVSGPNSVKVATPLQTLAAQSIPVDKAYLVSCTNSRASDIASAATVFREAASNNGGKIPTIAPGVKFYVAAASLPEQHAAEGAGDWDVLLAAGAEPLPAGCGPCIGLGTGLLEPGEVGISASNRNFKGRMGSTDAKAYLASPEVVAASALSGTIGGPGWFAPSEGVTDVIRGEGEPAETLTVERMLEKIVASAEGIVQEAESSLSAPPSTAPKTPQPEESEGRKPETSEPLVPVLPGFPPRIAGEIVWLDADNINTDGIYPGKYTYQDNITREEMAEVCMENYDPAFQSRAKEGDIIVSGFNFGCGSSREQAATCILAKGIPLVVAGSFGNIFSRNSINNALMGIEVPKLIHRLREAFPSSPEGRVLTRRTGWRFTWDVARSRVVVREGEEGAEWEQRVGEVPVGVQEIVARGGLEGWVGVEIGKGGVEKDSEGRGVRP